MSQKSLKVIVLYLTGLLQGVALATFSAAGSLLNNKGYNLTSSEYKGIFLPMILGAILSSFLGGTWAEHYGKRRILLWGLAFNILSMFAFAGTQFPLEQHQLTYGILLIALFLMGLGFGSTLTTLNTYVVDLFPKHITTAMSIMYALLGTGTALAPIFFNIFSTPMLWWNDPLAIAIIFALLFIGGLLFLELEVRVVDTLNPELIPDAPLTRTFWLYAGIIGIYGICETIFGNWASIYLNEEKGMSLAYASLALSAFWGFVVIGRIVIGLLSLWISPAKIYIALPFLIMVAFIAIPIIGVKPCMNIVFFGFAGLACSAILPLSISFAEHDFIRQASRVSGYLIASYMLGYGIAAYGVGVLREYLGLSMSVIYSGSAFIAFALLALILVQMRRHPRF